jgi:hypothetical protein
MRTTLSIDDDVLLAAKHEALRRNVSLGEAATDLMRAGLQASRSGDATKKSARSAVGRFAILPPRDEVITPEHVQRIIEQEGI